jgi:hypothetical protein
MTKAAERAARAQIAREHPFVSCGVCWSGWVLGSDDAMLGAKRCWCFRAHQAKVQALVDAAKERG